ncbi:hypothetical protein M5689_004729 [Euphorbia peplus]|nr:hypothetical protein M5689_004729 [Euphorbia peplus]
MDQEQVNIEYWLRWQVPVCGFIIIAPFLAAIYTIKNAKSTTLFFDDLWKSCWKSLNPIWLLCYRVFALICLAPFLYRTVAIEGASAFYFYTQWTYALVMFYFVLASVTSAYGIWFSTNQSALENENDGFYVEDITAINSIKLRAGIWGYLAQIIYQLKACMHSLNIVFLMLDTTLNNLPFPWFRLAYFVLWSCIYVVFQWTVHACGVTWWPYPFMELDTPWAPLWYFALVAIHIPCYGIYAVVHKAKNSFFHRRLPLAPLL